MNFSIINKTMLWLGIAGVVIATALWLFFSNLRPSIQFTGGMEVVTNAEVTDAQIESLDTALTDAGYVDFALTKGNKDGFGSVLLQQRFAGNEEVAAITELIQSTMVNNGTI